MIEPIPDGVAVSQIGHGTADSPLSVHTNCIARIVHSPYPDITGTIAIISAPLGTRHCQGRGAALPLLKVKYVCSFGMPKGMRTLSYYLEQLYV